MAQFPGHAFGSGTAGDLVLRPLNAEQEQRRPGVGTFVPVQLGASDATPPTITIISPAVGTLPSVETPIVIDVDDTAPGLRYIAITARYSGLVGEFVVFRRGTFRAPFTGIVTPVSMNLQRLTINPPNGAWPGRVTLAIDLIDAAGNLEGS
jgi:hypothetical protein